LNKLSGELPLLDLPVTKQRPRLKTNNGRKLSTYLSKTLSNRLREYSQQHGGTVFMGLLTSFNAILYHYTGQENFIIGSPIAGREHADLGSQIGFYVNTLALRNEVKAKDTFDELFLRVKQNTLNAYLHQMYPFDKLVEELSLQRDTSRNAIFDVMLVLQNNGEKTKGYELKEEDKDEITDHGAGICKFDIVIDVSEIGGRLAFSVEYNTDVYNKEIIESFIIHYKNLLSKCLLNPKQSLENIDYLSAVESEELLSIGHSEADYSKKTVMELFEEQVAKQPDKIALVF
jgi:non-ribosomal peptide synthetase component F